MCFITKKHNPILMKRKYLVVLITLISIITTTGFAQNQNKVKFGHVDVDSVLYRMDGFQTILDDYKKQKNQYEKAIQLGVEQLRERYYKFMEYKDSGEMPDDWLLEQQNSLQNEEKRLAEKEQEYSYKLQNNFQIGYDSLFTQIMEAVNTYAEKNDYTYIFDGTSAGQFGSQVLFASSSADLTLELMKHLGIDPKKKPVDPVKFLEEIERQSQQGAGNVPTITPGM